MMKKVYQCLLVLFLCSQSLQASKSSRVAPAEYTSESVTFKRTITRQNTISSRMSKMCVGCISSSAEQQAITASRASSYKVQPEANVGKGVTFRDVQDQQIAQLKNESLVLSATTVTNTLGITEPSISSEETQLSQPKKIKPVPQEKISMFESFTQFFSGKPDVNAKNRQGRTLLQEAVIAQNRKEIVRLVKEGADLNVKDSEGNTLLHLLLRDLKKEASDKKAYDATFSILKFLIKNNADVTIKNQIGQTPLHLAVQYIDQNAVQYLIKKNANINIQDSEGYTPLMAAMHSDIPTHIQTKENPARLVVANIIKQLIDAGADVTIKAKNGRSAVDDVTYQIRYHGLSPEVADYIHDAQFPKIKSKKSAPKTPSPYTSLSLANF